MATFYGQVEGFSQTLAGRRGSEESGIKSSVQSYNGSVIISLRQEHGEPEPYVDIQISNDSSFYGDNVFTGSISELKDALLSNRNQRYFENKLDCEIVKEEK